MAALNIYVRERLFAVEKQETALMQEEPSFRTDKLGKYMYQHTHAQEHTHRRTEDGETPLRQFRQLGGL